MQWAMSSQGTIQHHSLVVCNEALHCPCCRRAVVSGRDGFEHAEPPDCMCHTVPPWNSHSLQVFGRDTTQRRQFVARLLWSLADRRLAIKCNLCCCIEPLFAGRAGPLLADSVWRGLRLTMAEHHGAMATGLILVEDIAEAQTTQRYVQGMLDMSSFRVHILPLQADMDVASLQTGHLPCHTATCGMCHLVFCVEPLARQRLVAAASSARPMGPKAPPPPLVAPTLPRYIHSKKFGAISVVVDAVAWNQLTVEDRNRALSGELLPANAKRPVIGLWCLRCTPCTMLAHDTLLRRQGGVHASKDLVDDLRRFDADCVTYGPKIGISRRLRMVRHLRLQRRLPGTALELMLLECDTTGAYTYHL